MKVLLIGAIAYVLIVAVLARKKLRELHPKRFFLETWAEVDRRADEARARRAPVLDADGNVLSRARNDWRPWVAYLSLAVVLTMHEYFGDHTAFEKLRDAGLSLDWGVGPNGEAAHHLRIFGPIRAFASERWGELYSLWYWAAARIVGYLIVPVIALTVWRKRFRDYGLRLRGFLSHAWIYALFFGFVLIAVIFVSRTREFVDYYPFYRAASRSWRDFFYWECVYAMQFFALECYFRGFLLFSSEESLGSGVILAMVVPYCMIHFGKPILETLAAILAGTVLGTLALKTRSIWSGFLIHVTVAMSMDMAALLQKDGLPGGIHLPASWGF